MSFTGNETAPALGEIDNDGFWPTLDADLFIRQYHISVNFEAELLTDALVLSMIDINRKLQPLKTALLVDYADLDAYNTENSNETGGIEITVKKYQQAVFCYAKAHFLDVSKDSNRREEAKALAAEMPETKEVWLQKSANAVDFLFSEILPGTASNSGIRSRLITPTEPVYYAQT